MSTTRKIEGEQTPLPTTKVVRAYSLSAEVVAQVEELAAAENRNVSNMVETLLKRGIADRAKTREVVQAMVNDMQDFVDKVDRGEAKSKRSYAAFKYRIEVAKSRLQIEPTK